MRQLVLREALLPVESHQLRATIRGVPQQPVQREQAPRSEEEVPEVLLLVVFHRSRVTIQEVQQQLVEREWVPRFQREVRRQVLPRAFRPVLLSLSQTKIQAHGAIQGCQRAVEE